MSNCDDRWEKHNKKLDSIKADRNLKFLSNGYFGKFIRMPLEVNDEMTENEIKVLRKHFKDVNKYSVLEVGAGFGNFCKHLKGAGAYTILDSSSMIRFSKKFLEHHGIECNFVPSDQYKSLFDCYGFDLFISNICISETPKEYREDLMENILPKCKGLFMIDGCKKPGFNDWLEKTVKKHFKNVLIQPMPYDICLQKNQNLYIGKK